MNRLCNMMWTLVSYAVSFQLLLLTKCTVQYCNDTSSELVLKAVHDGGTRISGIQDREDKDIILGGLLRVHKSDGKGKCGEIFSDKTLENLEAVLFAIDLVNSDPHVLPNITLGYDIRDTCISENIALDESVDLVFSSGRLELESCYDSELKNNDSARLPVVAVIGAVYSSISIPLASFFRVFNIPQVSFGSTSPLLRDRDLYTYFYRTVPPDSEQAQAMIDLIVYFSWDHVSTIYSTNLYGRPGIDEFHDLAKAKSVCIDYTKGIDDSTDYVLLAKNLLNSTANVVVLFASAHHVELLLTELQTLYSSGTSKRQFLWIASDSWSQELDTKYKDITIGKWGTAPYSDTMSSFVNYYSQLIPATYARNPWFCEFYEHYYNCKIGVNCSNTSIVNDSRYTFHQDSYDAAAIDAVYSVAHAVNNFLNDNCKQPLVWYPENQTCLGQNRTLNGSNLLEYIKNVNFTSPTKNQIYFDEYGGVKPKYNIYNYQVVSSCQNCKSFKIVNVGYWDGSFSLNRLKFNLNTTKQFGLDESGNIIYQLKSQCQSCNTGYIKREVISSCCGTCDPCLGQSYTNTTSSTECQMCPQYMWGNDPLNGSHGCVDIKESYLKPSDGWSIVLILLAIIGLLAVVFVSGVFIYFWNTPIVKSSGREQMILLLSGITLCFLITVVFIPKPSVTVCTLQRIGAWFCFSLIVCAVFIKLVRIARIFLQKDITSRPMFIAPIHQILFTFLLVGAIMVLEVISLIVVHPGVTKNQVNDTQNTNDFPILVLQCTTPHIALLAIQMLYLSALMIACNALAILTIRFPQNFNESKYVAFSTFAMGLVWIAFIITYFATDAQFQAAVISLAIQLSALAVLVCLFCPRVFIMIVWPSQNVKSASTAAKSTSLSLAKTTASELPAQPE